jgi:hypothetical protein
MPSARTKQAVQESRRPDSWQEQAVLALALNMQDGDKPLKTSPESPLTSNTAGSHRPLDCLLRCLVKCFCLLWVVFAWFVRVWVVPWAPPGEVVVAPREIPRPCGVGVVVRLVYVFILLLLPMCRPRIRLGL